MAAHRGALAGHRYRVIVSTDIGGSDPDDFQSLVHYLVYSDLFDTEGLISSPWGDGQKEHILEVIDVYEQDYPNLRSYSAHYPHPDYLRSIAKQGAIDLAPLKGYSTPTEGSDWIIHCARRDDPRPLYVLIWGTIDDLAQALHDDPGIEERLRVYYIAGPNKKWGINAYEYLERRFPHLWIIENNSTYRGWFVGGNQSGDLGNSAFVAGHVAGHGALGSYFAGFLGGRMKMGDTPSVAYLLWGHPDDPTRPSWGGSFVPVWSRPRLVHHGLTTLEDRVEVFGALELVLQGPDIGSAGDEPQFHLVAGGQEFCGYYCGGGEYRARFVSKSTGEVSYLTKSDIPELDGLAGQFTCVDEAPHSRGYRPEIYRNWWSDMLDPELREGEHSGAVTVSRWRPDFLRHFQERMDRCRAPLSMISTDQ